MLEKRKERILFYYRNQFENLHSNEQSLNAFKMYLSRLEPMYDELFNIDTAIAEIDINQSDQNYIEMAFNTIKLLYDKKEACNANSISINSINLAGSNLSRNELSNVNLPRITLPSFDGTYENWPSFRDTYVSLIHASMTISDIEKYHDLKASLVGEAAKCIESLQLSNQNYAIAWKTLVDRFDNKKQIIKNHIRSILNLSNINKNTLRDSVDNITKDVRALKACNEPVDTWDTLLIGIITAKFENKLNEDWESIMADTESPKYEHLINFLTKKCKIFEAVNDINKVWTSSRPSGINKINHNKKSSLATKPVNNFKCIMCAAEHSIYKCPSFLKLSPPNRYDVIKSKNLCTNCLREGHKPINCYSCTCKYCNLKHNSLLHFNNKNESTDKIVNKQQADQSSEVPSTSLYTQIATQVILSTALVKIVHNDNTYLCRAVLDSGSQANFITNKMIRKLNLKQDGSLLNFH